MPDKQIKTECPHCKKIFENAFESWVGQQVNCTTCNNPFIVYKLKNSSKLLVLGTVSLTALLVITILFLLPNNEKQRHLQTEIEKPELPPKDLKKKWIKENEDKILNMFTIADNAYWGKDYQSAVRQYKSAFKFIENRGLEDEVYVQTSKKYYAICLQFLSEKQEKAELEEKIRKEFEEKQEKADLEEKIRKEFEEKQEKAELEQREKDKNAEIALYPKDNEIAVVNKNKAFYTPQMSNYVKGLLRRSKLYCEEYTLKTTELCVYTLNNLKKIGSGNIGLLHSRCKAVEDVYWSKGKKHTSMYKFIVGMKDLCMAHKIYGDYTKEATALYDKAQMYNAGSTEWQVYINKYKMVLRQKCDPQLQKVFSLQKSLISHYNSNHDEILNVIKDTYPYN